MEKQGNLPPPYTAQPPPPAGFVPPPQAHPHPPPTSQVYVQQQVQHLGPESQHLICPSCHTPISSRVETEANMKTHLMALLLFAVGCWLCCCFPYFMDSCQSKRHNCPKCGAYLGTYSN